MIDEAEQVTRCWQMYRNGLDYVRGLGLPETVRTNVAFYEGNQWAPPTKATKNLPRPVVNMVKFVCRNKRARLSLTPVKLVYRCEGNTALGERFTRFADHLAHRMGLAQLDNRAIKDGLIKGSYCYHFYRDKEAENQKGALRCELIDPLHVFFANPRESDEQRQPWIIIASRVSVADAKAMADSDVDVELLRPDEDDSGVHEQADSALCTVLTRYFRVDGDVWCERCAKYAVLNKPYALSPATDDEFGHAAPRVTLYPVVFGSYEERENSIYGISEVEGILPNQRVINQILGLEALAIQNTAWGKYVVTKDALKGQQISNEPGEVLVDYSAAGNGIRKMEHASLSGLPVNYVDNLTNLTRTISGASEIMTGEQLHNMSGTAIAQLQSQANKPIEEQRERFWRVKERQGQVLAQYCCLYYDHLVWYDTCNGQEVAQQFAAEEYRNATVTVTVHACMGTDASIAADVNLLETLFARGAIDAVTFVRAYPDEALCNKERILGLLQDAAPDGAKINQ